MEIVIVEHRAECAAGSLARGTADVPLDVLGKSYGGHGALGSLAEREGVLLQ
jgi:hypothetical protein